MRRRQYYPHSYTTNEIRSMLTHSGLYKTHQVTVALPINDFTKLKLMADYKKTTMSNLVDTAIVDMFKPYEQDDKFKQFVADMMKMSSQHVAPQQLSKDLEKRILNE